MRIDTISTARNGAQAARCKTRRFPTVKPGGEMPRQAPPVLESGLVGGADDCDLLSKRARRGLDRAQRGYAGGGRAGRPGGGVPLGCVRGPGAAPAGRCGAAGAVPRGRAPMRRPALWRACGAGSWGRAGRAGRAVAPGAGAGRGLVLGAALCWVAGRAGTTGRPGSRPACRA